MTTCTSPEHFRAYFVGKLLHRANSKCSYVEFPGGSLIRKDTSTSKILLSDLLHGVDVELDGLTSAERARWWAGTVLHFREFAEDMYPGLFASMEDGEIEHSACEFVRMCRKLFRILNKCPSLMLPTILEIFEEGQDSDSDED